MAVFTERIMKIQGREYILRSAREEDAPQLIAYLKQTTAESPYLLREPEEVTLTQEREKSFIGRLLNLYLPQFLHHPDTIRIAAVPVLHIVRKYPILLKSQLFIESYGSLIGRYHLQLGLLIAHLLCRLQRGLQHLFADSSATVFLIQKGDYGVRRDKMIRQMELQEIDKCVQVIRDSFMTVADAFGFTRENAPPAASFCRFLCHSIPYTEQSPPHICGPDASSH